MINLGLIGAGRWGKNYIRTINKMENVNLSFVVDQNPQGLAGLIPETTFFSKDINEVRAIPIDGVIIASPTCTHASFMEHFIRLNVRYILCEKPMAISTRDAQNIAFLNRKLESQIFVGHTYLFHNALNEGIRRVKRGEIGDLLYVSSERLNFGPVRYDMNAVSDLVVHDISIFKNMFEYQIPEVLSAHGLDATGNGVEDVVEVKLDYKYAPVHIRAGWLNPEKVRKICFIGSRGMIVFDEMSENVLTKHNKFLETRHDFGYNEVDDGIEVIEFADGMSLSNQLSFFAEAVELQADIDNVSFSTDIMVTIDCINRELNK